MGDQDFEQLARDLEYSRVGLESRAIGDQAGLGGEEQAVLEPA